MFTRKDIIKLMVPLIIEQVLAVAIGMADTMMVASCGEAAVSGVSLVDSINVLLINIFSALATGGSIICAQYIGRDDHANANASAKQLIAATFLVSAVIMIVCLFGNGLILSAIFPNTENAVMENCLIYFFWSAISYPFLGVYNAGAALFRSMGNSRITMVISVAMNLLNIGGNAVLIFGFHMGVAGAAIATLVSRIFGAVVTLYLLRWRSHGITIDSLLRWRLDFRMIRTILKIGIPNGLENGMFQIGKILVQGFVASFGTIAIAANAVANSVASMAVIPGAAVGLGMITIVGQCVGARRYDEAKRYMFKLTGLAYVLMAIVNIIIFLLLNPLIGMFNLSSQTASITYELLLYHGIMSSLLWPMAFTLPNGLRAANDVKYTMLVSVISMWACRIGLSYVFGSIMGLQVLGVWIAMTIDWAVRIIFFLGRVISGRWKKKEVI